MRFVIVVAVLIVLILLLKGWRGSGAISAADVNPDTYQAVFLINGQHYFGHLEAGKRDGFTLTDVYYVQPQQNDPTADPANQQFQLIKFGNEIHGPEDVLHLNWSNVLFWENLRADSKVVNGIAQEKERRAQAATLPPVAPAVTAPAVTPAQ